MKQEQKELIRSLRLQGWGYKRIAKELRLNRNQVQLYCKTHGLAGAGEFVKLNLPIWYEKVREKALNIALNKITGAWDDTLLAELLEDIVITCAMMSGTGTNAKDDYTAFRPARKSKTVTQDAWDTMVYRPDLNKIYMIRFGAGEDREIDVN